jgi:predicted AAA+ superfamily ATPase
LRELAFPAPSSGHISLDRVAAREAATRNPEHFLAELEAEPIIIDKAHKAPPLFDEIKAMVDEARRPGRFILTGSVRFSNKIGIRESFTGRACGLLFDSLLLSETTSDAPSLKTIQNYLKKGGMPGVCFLRDLAQINNYWTQWLETSCHRDLLEYGKGRLSGDLAYRVLESTCQLEFPSASAIARKLRVDTRRVKTHLEALSSLFLLRPWEPDEHPVGKTLYLPIDCGLAHYFEADIRRRWQTWVAHQILNQARHAGLRAPVLRYNLSARGSFADFSLKSEALLFNDQAFPDSALTKTVTALERRLPDRKILVCSMTDQRAQRISPRSTSIAWKELVTKTSRKPEL